MIPLSVERICAALDAPAPERGPVRRVVFDHREAQAGDLFVGLEGRHFDGGRFAESALASGAELALTGPGPACSGVVRCADAVAALARVAALVREDYRGPAVAITGSMGKTTVKTWLTALSSAVRPTVGPPKSFNNLEGVSRTLFQLEQDTELLVLEMGTNAPGEIARLARLGQPTHVVLTAIGPSHLEGLGSIDGVLREKTALADALEGRGTIFVNADDERLDAWADATSAEVLRVSLNAGRKGVVAPAAIAPGCITLPEGEGTLRHDLATEVQVRNLWLAWVVARHFGGSIEAQRAVVTQLEVPALRGELRAWGDSQLILDCYNASPLSMKAALRDLAARPGTRIAILGDMLELGAESEAWHRALADEARTLNLDALWFIGEFHGLFDALPGTRTFRTLGEARAAFGELKNKAAWVLLKASRGLALEGLLEDRDE